MVGGVGQRFLGDEFGDYCNCHDIKFLYSFNTTFWASFRLIKIGWLIDSKKRVKSSERTRLAILAPYQVYVYPHNS